MQRKKGQAPKLSNIALRRGKTTERRDLETVVVRPAPDLAAQLVSVLVDEIPKVVVC
jgi:hypothetical protein